MISENCQDWAWAGVIVQDNSYLSSQGNDEISDNIANGVSLTLDSTASFHRNTSITNNTDYGIFCEDYEIRVGNFPGELSGNNQDYGGVQTNCFPY